MGVCGGARVRGGGGEDMYRALVTVFAKYAQCYILKRCLIGWGEWWWWWFVCGCVWGSEGEGRGGGEDMYRALVTVFAKYAQ